MSINSLWADIATQWSAINSHANTLLREVFEQDYWILNSLAQYRGQLFQNQSRSIDQLEQLTYNAVWMIELTLDNLIEAVDLSVEARFRGLESVLNDHLYTITEYLKDAVELVAQSGSMDYGYVDEAIYAAEIGIYGEIDDGIEHTDDEIFGLSQTINTKIDSSVSSLTTKIEDNADYTYLRLAGLQGQINAIETINVAEIKSYVDEAILDLQSDILIDINTLKNNMVDRLESVDTYINEEVLFLAGRIDSSFGILQADIEAKAASIRQYVDTLGGDIYAHITAQRSGIIAEARALISAGMEAVNLRIDDIITTFDTKLATLQTAVKTYVDNIASDILVLLVNTELRVTDQIQKVGFRVTALSTTSAWRAGFFDIFRSVPELSFLQVLLRDKEKFAEFKPYWQALFTRVMAED